MTPEETIAVIIILECVWVIGGAVILYKNQSGDKKLSFVDMLGFWSAITAFLLFIFLAAQIIITHFIR